VGGTTLNLSSTNQISSETAWNAAYVYIPGYGWTIEGGGGGVSSYESEPAFQSSNGVPNNGGRSTPDVSWDANPSTGVSVYDSYREPGWGYVGGTSAGAPAWAGIVAIADQQSVANGHGSLSTAQVESALYGVYHSSGGASYTSGSAYASDFHDITSGSNGYHATTGYDLATGLGSPKVSAIVNLLAGSPPSPAAAPAGATTATTTGSALHGTTGGVGRPNVLFTLFEDLSTAASLLPVPVPVSATNAPVVSAPPSGSAGSPTAGISNVTFVFNLMTEGSPPSSLPNASVPFDGSLNTSVSQNTIVFGASGWSGSGNSRRLSSHNMHGPAAEEFENDLADALVGAPAKQPDTVLFDENISSGDDASILDPAAPTADAEGGADAD
jgi:hypothetical protein